MCPSVFSQRGSHIILIYVYFFYLFTYMHTYWPLYWVHLASWTSKGWTPFAFRTAFISSWHRFNNVLETFLVILVRIDMIASRSCCWFVGCTSMMRISRSTTSQRCSIGLRSGDFGGHLSKVNSLSRSRNQSEMIWALWHGALSCWK